MLNVRGFAADRRRAGPIGASDAAEEIVMFDQQTPADPASHVPGRVASANRRVLDRLSPQPLWQQLLDDLRGRMRLDEFEDRFPTDRELMAVYGVSRHTVREAVRRLHDEGSVERARGKGSFVVHRSAPDGVASSVAVGADEMRRVLVLEERYDDDTAPTLGARAKARIVHVQRLITRRGVPYALEEWWFPSVIGKALVGPLTGRVTVEVDLALTCGIEVDETSETIKAALLDGSTAALLGASPGAPALVVERLGRSGGRLVERRLVTVAAEQADVVIDPVLSPQPSLRALAS